MLRRPLLYPAAGFAAAVLFYFYAGAVISVSAGIGLLVLCIMQKQDSPLLPAGRLRIRLFLAGYFAGLICFCVSTWKMESEASRLLTAGDNCVTAEAVVTDRDDKISQSGEKYVQMTVKLCSLDNEIVSGGKVLVSCYDECDSVPGDIVTLRGAFEKPQGRRNPGCFDYSLYLKSLGITAVMTADRVEDAAGSGTLWQRTQGRLFVFKKGFSERLAKDADAETAALMQAVMFGDKGLLDRDVLDVFQKNGTAHILAVSGLHIGIIYGFILKLWRRRKGKLFFAFVGTFFGCYTVLAGFSPSVVRAVFMVLLHVFAQLNNKRYDLDNAAFLVALAVLIRNPYMMFNTGFQMSFLAVLTMILVLPYIRKFYTGVLLASLVVQIGLGPFIIYSFNYLSLGAVFINVPVVFLAGLIVPVGLVSLALQPTVFFEPLARMLDVLCGVLEWINRTCEIDGITVFQIASPPLWLMAFYYIGLLAFASEEGRLAIMRATSKVRHVSRVFFVVLVLSMGFSAFAGDGFGGCNLTFVDVGQGDCVCVHTDGGLFGRDRCYIFDGGGNVNYNIGKQTLRPYLLKSGMSHVDGAFVTHLHTDHYKGVCELAREGMVDRIYVYEGNRAKAGQISDETGLPESAVIFLHAGQQVDLGTDGGQEVSVDVLWPEAATDAEYLRMLADEENENATSLIFRLNFGGSDDANGGTGVLITGDMSEEGEAELMGAYGGGTGRAGLPLHADILKVGHHGSRTSTSEAFLKAVNPDIAVIQVGKNNYGHPTPEVLERLADTGAEVYRNDQSGAVGFCIKNGEVEKVKKMVNNFAAGNSCKIKGSYGIVTYNTNARSGHAGNRKRTEDDRGADSCLSG